jgi:uncharacterized membrane protein
MRRSLWQPSLNKISIVLVLLWGICGILWSKNIPFSGLIGGTLLIIYAVLLFRSPEKFGYRTFIFLEKYFDDLFQKSQKYFAIGLMIISLIIIFFPYCNLSIGLLGIIFFGTCFWIALMWLLKAAYLQQQGVLIEFTKKVIMWCILSVSIIMVIVSLLILFGNRVE